MATFAGQSVTVPANDKASIKAHLDRKAHADLLVDGKVAASVTALDEQCDTQVGGVKITATPTPSSATPSTSTTAVAVKGVKLADTGAGFPVNQAILLSGLMIAGGALLLAAPKLSAERRRRH